MNMDVVVIRTLRMQAWERAKGELRAMTMATWPGSENPPTDCDSDKFQKLQEAVDSFIEKMEYEEWYA